MTTWDTGELRRIRRRKRIRGPLTLVFLLALLGGAAYFGYKAVIDVEPQKTVTSCSTPGANGEQVIESSKVKINVYNAGSQHGEAGRLADALEKRGFQRGEVDNDPQKRKVKVVEIRGRAANAPEVQLVRKQFGASHFEADGRKDYSVDVVIGDKFGGVVKAPTTLRVKSPLAACTTSTPTAPA